MRAENRATRWRFVPLATALTLLVVSFATFGVGLLFAPIAVLMTVLSARRLAAPRGSAYWLGAMLSGALMVGFVTVVALIWMDA